MKTQIAFICLTLIFAQVSTAWPQSTAKKAAAFSFADVNYFHRFTKDEQHEYTPDGQADLKAWTDMVTIHFYRQAKDGDALAGIANAVLENYKANRAVVVKTASVPRTKDKPAEHLIVVTFSRPEFIEVAFARFRMLGGVGNGIIYSHRIYGNKVGNEMSAWLAKNGAGTEKNLMQWDALPKPALPRDCKEIKPACQQGLRIERPSSCLRADY